MNFMPRFVTLGLIVGLVNISLAANESQRNSQNGITLLAATESPNPSTALDRDILKSSPFIDSTGTIFFGSIDSSFRACQAHHPVKVMRCGNLSPAAKSFLPPLWAMTALWIGFRG